jgi:hypothetical protein
VHKQKSTGHNRIRSTAGAADSGAPDVGTSGTHPRAGVREREPQRQAYAPRPRPSKPAHAHRAHAHGQFTRHTYTFILSTLYPSRGSRGISEIPPRND